MPIGSYYQNTMSHKCTGLLVTQPSVSLSLCWSLSLHLVAQSSRSFLLLIHSHQESQSNSANVEEARRWGWCMGSMPFTRGQNLMYTWRLTATDCIYFLQQGDHIWKSTYNWNNYPTKFLSTHFIILNMAS